jgi:hypothetical protein
MERTWAPGLTFHSIFETKKLQVPWENTDLNFVGHVSCEYAVFAGARAQRKDLKQVRLWPLWKPEIVNGSYYCLADLRDARWPCMQSKPAFFQLFHTPIFFYQSPT